MTRRPFLTAEWRYLSMLNFRIDPDVLRPYVPAGTELDVWQGDTLVSVVGFRFLDTRVLGWPIPGHRDFDEVNLRFYVRRLVNGEMRRAVTFLREVVPRHAIALIARIAYNEPYITCRMRSDAPDVPAVADPGPVCTRGVIGADGMRYAPGPLAQRARSSQAARRSSSPSTTGATHRSATAALSSMRSAIRRGASGTSPMPTSTVTWRRCTAIGSSRR